MALMHVGELMVVAVVRGSRGDGSGHVAKRTAIDFLERILLQRLLHLATLQCGLVCIVQTSVLVDRGAVASCAAAARLVGNQLVCTRSLHHGHGCGALLRRLADAGGDHLALARVSQQFAADWLHIRCVLLQSRGRDAIDATEANLRRSALAAP